MTETQPYHHGNLRAELIREGRGLLEEAGLSGLSLRKCAERAGVSAMAPKNHFGNLAGLLTAIATEGYFELSEAMAKDCPEDANRATRRECAMSGYVRFAEDNPALYDLMFSRERILTDDPALVEAVRACFVILADGAKELGWYGMAENAVTDAKGQVALWSFVHGYSQLVIAGRLKKDAMQGLSILDILPPTTQ